MTVYSTYAAGLAAVADGGNFEVASSDGLRLHSFVRESAEIGRLLGIEPVASLATLAGTVRAAARANRLPASPLLDYDPVMSLYSLKQHENLAAGSPAPGLNAFASSALSTDEYSVNGGTVASIGAATGATTAGIRVQIAAGSAAGSNILFLQPTPAGQWCFSFDVQCHPSAAQLQNLWAGLSGAAFQAVAVTGAVQTVTCAAAHYTAEGNRLAFVYQPGYGVAQTEASTQAVDVIISNIRLVPGATAGAAAVLGLPAHCGYAKAMTLDGSLRTTTNANAVRLDFAAAQNLSSWSYIVAIDAQKAAGASAFFAVHTDSAVIRHLQSWGIEMGGALTSGLLHSNGNRINYACRIAGMGQITLGAVYVAGGALTLYVNGIKVTTDADVDSAMMQQVAVRSIISGAASAIGGINGLRSGEGVWASAITDAQMSAAHSALAARVAARGLAVRALGAVYFGEGDSITAGVSWPDFAAGQMAAPMVGRNTAVSGATLHGASNSLDQRAAGDDALIAGYKAAGLRVIMPVLIGTNDGAVITSQALAETYYADLKTYWAARRAAGAEVLASTLIPFSTPAVYDATPITISGGPLGGQTFAGTRGYINALIRLDPSAYDGLIDFAADPRFASWSATYYNDGAHPNAAGKTAMAAIASAAMSARVAAGAPAAAAPVAAVVAVVLLGSGMGMTIPAGELVQVIQS